MFADVYLIKDFFSEYTRTHNPWMIHKNDIQDLNKQEMILNFFNHDRSTNQNASEVLLHALGMTHIAGGREGR